MNPNQTLSKGPPAVTRAVTRPRESVGAKCSRLPEPSRGATSSRALPAVGKSTRRVGSAGAARPPPANGIGSSRRSTQPTSSRRCRPQTASAIPVWIDPKKEKENAARKRALARPLTAAKRPQSASPTTRKKSPSNKKPADPVLQRRCQSLSPSKLQTRRIADRNLTASSISSPETLDSSVILQHLHTHSDSDKECSIPHCMAIKLMRTLSTKKREFTKARKNLISLQNQLIDQYASLKELEQRSGAPPDETLGDFKVMSVSSWPAHDLLLLIRDDLEIPLTNEISGAFGPQVLQQLHAQLSTIPDEVYDMGQEILARRIDLINLLRGKYRTDRSSYLTNLEWKTKNTEFDQETDRLQRLISGITENLKAKINYSLELAKIPWLDRESLVKKSERLHKENMIQQHKLEELTKKECEAKESNISHSHAENNTSNTSYQTVHDELQKERAAREALKDVVSAAESMLRVARARIATLERQLKEVKTELEASRRKHKDLEQLVKQLANTRRTYRHRETSYDARSKKLLEVSKTGEVTIEALSRQRDALELRVRELREQAEIAERAAENRTMEQKARAETLQAKVAEQEKRKESAERKVAEYEAKIKDLEDMLHNMRERSSRLVEIERRRCLDYVPSKENEPSDRETEVWKELQVTRLALSRAEEELRLSRADKDNFLNSLSKIAQDSADKLQDKMAAELIEREQKITKLQHVIEEQKENEKLMEQSMTQYENQLAALRLEVKRLRNYDCYSKDVPYQELQTELLELHMQVETLTRERTALVTAAASRALMLERHERAADLFSRVTRARRDLAALLDGRTDPPPIDELAQAEVTRSLSSVCATAAETWTALRAERARVLRLESAVLAQSLQLEREGRVRTQLERRRALLQREVLRGHASSSSEPNSMIQDIFCYR